VLNVPRGESTIKPNSPVEEAEFKVVDKEQILILKLHMLIMYIVHLLFQTGRTKKCELWRAQKC
jgi:hypothetical protein